MLCFACFIFTLGRPDNKRQTSGNGSGNQDEDEWGSLSGDSDNKKGEEEYDDDSFEERLQETIEDGVNDVREGRNLVQGGKRTHGDMKVINFTEEDEAKNILKECPHDVVDTICSLPRVEDCTKALNQYLNGVILQLPVQQQQVIYAKATASEKFSKLKEFVEAATSKAKKMKT